MTKKRIISFALVLAIISCLLTALAGSAGTSSDPLISKSYINSTYSADVLAKPLNTLADAITVLKYKLAQKTTSNALGLSYAIAMPGGSVTLFAGSGIALVFGSVRLSSTSGTVIDVTDGNEIFSGQNLIAGHRYVAAESTTASISVITGSKFALYGSVSIVTTEAPKFTDVTDGLWHYPYVCYAVKNGLVNGRSEMVYAPDANLSIAEAIKLAACMHQLYKKGSVTLVNDATTWYKTYLDYATLNGIVTKTYADYDASITRSEFVAIFYAALPDSQYTQKNTVGDNTIPDVKLTATNASKIYAFYRAGILTGSDRYGTFYPNNFIKRSEVAAILTRMFEKDARQIIT